jgi:Abortive infection C-terminus
LVRPLISRKTLIEFREYMTGWVLRQIDDEFSAAGIPAASSTNVDVRSGARRLQVELYYASLDLTKPADAARLALVFENVISLGTRAYPERAAELIAWIEKDGYAYEGGRLRRKAFSGTQHIASKFAVADASSIHDEIRRIEDSIVSDPALAIGSSKELIETVCKTILDAKGEIYTKNADLSELVKAATKALKMTPDDIPSAAKGADLIKRTLHSLASVVGSIGELRTLYGSGHGKSAKAKGLQPRHARLVAGAASALVTFLWDTFEQRATS